MKQNHRVILISIGNFASKHFGSFSGAFPCG
jgi:hypothetical protein